VVKLAPRELDPGDVTPRVEARFVRVPRGAKREDEEEGRDITDCNRRDGGGSGGGDKEHSPSLTGCPFCIVSLY